MRSNRYWLAFGVCAAAAALPFLVTYRLPMVDLPEHAAQVALWKHFDDPCHRFAEHFQLNWRTPYLLGYVIARAFALFMNVNAAMKATVFLAIVAVPLAFRILLLRTRADPWLSLLGFPLAFGFSFYWGFLNFLVAIPIAIVFIAVAYDQAGEPTRRHALWLFVLAMLLLVSHALLLVLCGGVALALAIVRRHSGAQLLVPLAIPLGALAAGVIRMRVVEHVSARIVWYAGWFRLRDLPTTLLSNEHDHAAILGAAALVLCVLVTRPRPTRDARRWAIVAVLALAYFGAPQLAFGSMFLFGRFAVLLFVVTVFAFDGSTVTIARTAIVLVVVSWMALLTMRFQQFHREAADFDLLVDAMPTGRRVLMFSIEPFSEAVPGAVMFHFGAYYQQRKGGLVAWSFAGGHPQLVRYRPGVEPHVRSMSVPGDPPTIDWAGASQYDDVIFRSHRNVAPSLFAHAPVTYQLRGRRGAWWWFENRQRPHDARPPCPPLEPRDSERNPPP